VWEKGDKGFRLAVSVFGVQLVLNIMWSAVFFGLRSPFLGLLEIAALWVAIAVNIAVFWRIRKASGYLLVPYIIWVSLAALLNYNIWILN